MVKALMPVMTLVLAWIWSGELSSRGKVFSCVLLMIGIIAGVAENAEFHSIGFFFAFCSAVLHALQPIVTCILLQEEKIPPLSMALAASIPSIIVVIPVFFFYEYHLILSVDLDHKARDWTTLALISFVSLGYLLAGVFVTKYTSAIYTSVLNSIKVVLVLLVSFIVFPVHLSLANILGLFLSIFAFCLFNYFALKEQQHPDIDLDRLPLANIV